MALYKDLEVRRGEDLRQPYEPEEGADLSDWATWQLATYLYTNGVLVKTITESATADGVITRTGVGYFYSWVKSAYTLTLPVSTLLSAASPISHFLQTRRIDSGYNTLLHEGVLKVKPYSTAA